MGRVLGVDLGARRIGLALSDALRMTASPLAVLERNSAPGTGVMAHLESIAAVAAEHQADCIVVGVPRSLDGRDGPAARAARAEIDALRALVPEGVLVDTVDERFTTVIAHGVLARRGVKAKQRKGTVDQVAAAVLLQSWLDAHQ